MPKSLSISLAIAFLGAVLFFWATWGETPSPDSDEYISVALGFFNATAILCLFVILARKEKSSAEDFGQLLRDNISTIVVALFINIIMTIHNLLLKFGILTLP